MEKELLDQFKKQLEQEKLDLEKKLSNVADVDPLIKGNYNAKHPNLGSSEEENADEVSLYEQNLSEEHEFEKDLTNVKEALERIENGTYGNCLKCGKEISKERLQIYPVAKYCVNCKDS